MSLTLPSPSFAPERRTRPWLKTPRLIGPASLIGAAGLAVVLVPPDGAGLAARAAEPHGVAPGTDGTLLLAALLSRATGLETLASLWAVSWFALPVLAAACLCSRGGGRGAAALGSLALVCNPLVAAACADGHGFAALGFFALWLHALPAAHRPGHVAQPLLGFGVLMAAVFTPSAQSLALPLFAVLFLFAAEAGGGRTRALYLTAFAPVGAWVGMLAYAAWQTGAEGAGALPGWQVSGLPFLVALPVGILFAALCAPGLVLATGRRRAGAAALLACGLAATSPGVPLSLALLAASLAGAARYRRYGGPVWLALGLLGTAACAALLANPPESVAAFMDWQGAGP